MEADGSAPTLDDQFIAFTTDKIGGMGRYLLDTAIEVGAVRGIGWDIHFSAYGTSCIGIYSGLMGAGRKGNQRQEMKQTGVVGDTFESSHQVAMNNIRCFPTFPPMDVSQFCRQRYLGANNPLIQFDTTGSRFNFQQLHTTMFIGNESQAGGINVLGNAKRYDAVNPTAPQPDDASAVNAVADAGDKVLFINRRLKGNEYCPDMCPYLQDMTEYTLGLTATEIDLMNPNLEPYSICDADSGIFLEDFGVSEEYFPNSLWGVLGFTWAQFNSTTTFSRQTRLRNPQLMRILLPWI